jgi:NAD-dependent SIR2 family protein deacetylase
MTFNETYVGSLRATVGVVMKTSAKATAQIEEFQRDQNLRIATQNIEDFERLAAGLDSEIRVRAFGRTSRGTVRSLTRH